MKGVKVKPCCFVIGGARSLAVVMTVNVVIIDITVG